MARFIRVSTIAFGNVEPGDDYKSRLRDKMVADLELAAQAKPDLVALPETFNMSGYPWEQWPDNADTIPGPLFDAAAEVAARHRMYICFPILERDGDRLFNTACFIGRDGQVIGKYHKYQPTIGEIEAGILPGVDAEAFDTDFGKVGTAICFDLKFIEVGQRLAANGARLVVWPSAFIGGERLAHWARDFGFYVLSCCTARSYLVDMSGRFLGTTGWEDNQVRAGLLPPIFSAVINMDRMLFHLDYNQDKFRDMLAKYGAGIEIENHYPEAHFTLASLMEDVTVEDLVKEYDLEPWTAYLNRARGVRLEYLRKAGYDV
ncbi:MAG: carbon-nitrogen hydrolase family protein [Armatimonadetes bacterium]|nr:carbon-nitrogen hydrolase family protein [Armatimonadota bacterium]